MGRARHGSGNTATSLLVRAGACSPSVSRNLCRARVDTTCRKLAIRWRLTTVISKMRGANRNFSSRMWVVAEAQEASTFAFAFAPVRGRGSLRVMPVSSARPAGPMVARWCWRRAPLGDRTQSVQTMVRIVLLFPSVLSLFLGGDRKHLDLLCDFGFLEVCTFSRWFSSLKKRFKNHDGKTVSPASHEMESFGLSWLLADGTTKACHPTW